MSEGKAVRVGIVTGGAGALGRWVVGELARRGDRIHVPRRPAGTDRGLLEFLTDRFGEDAAARVSVAECDVTDPEAVERFVAGVVDAEGRLEILVNGVGGFTMGSLEETGPGTWRRMIELNATSAFLCSRAAAPAMGRAAWGRVVNVASMPALERGAAGMSAYAPAKAALLNLTYSLAAELRPNGITVNAVVPTIIDTPANREAMPDADRSTWLHPGEIARVVAFLASEDGGPVNGAAIRLGKA
ncbi:MAG: SDR family NAD(P)-dependent oxidoreductase [Gemmatimonadetes bacterium]|nr:SDR family NAD(P)-dependent oxidoreductase [Gemmatimonadota bacterium]NIR77983.1 SDR family NAD(P)-dependent oxidoreductase [Gemmatimonadota bacterium]NIT86519.1 SDR family NAD(P)-dependent oxidoreductase [Gemmatimonadota bacterium]NIU30379.1 SDR family NAD(P)-dependent oxidoreductase [Gemmatimonadota bacterium]NIU35257.1 SDR family NAD(P)-dependent oxidoreductase [Gemmatimonadota bacterium]